MKNNYLIGYFNPLSLNGIKKVIDDNIELSEYWSDSIEKEKSVIEDNNIEYLLGWSEVAKKPLLYLYEIGYEYDERFDCDRIEYKKIDSFNSEEEALNYINQKKYINQILTFSEAQEKWGLSKSTLRKAVYDNRFKEGEIRKSGNTWLVTEEAMKRLYGEPENG